MQKRLLFTPCALLCAVVMPVAQSSLAADYSISGFGTIGYAQSNQSYNYQRVINKSGTFSRDTVFGAQIDARFNPEWGATVQAKYAPAIDRDSGFKPVISWAFLSYRPDNDLLIRAGKLRVPFYLYSENMDVGVTYAAARLPNELYLISPTMDFTGASFVKNWAVGDNELYLDGYWGNADMPWRRYNRDTATPSWVSLKNKAKGLLLTFHQEENVYRAGMHSADIRYANGTAFPVTMAPNPPPPIPGMTGSYYTPSGTTSTITAPTFACGADIGLGQGFRTVAEYVRRKIKGMDIGPDTESYYVSVLKTVDRWTPYVTYANIESKNLAIYQAVNGARVQGGPPGVADGINATQRDAADNVIMYDQRSWAFGTSYSIDNKNKIKAEWLVVRTGAVSNFVDAPVGGESGNRRINVFSLSYSFVF